MSDLPPPAAPSGGGIPRGIRAPSSSPKRASSPNASAQLRRKIAEAFEGYTKAGAVALNTAGDPWSAEVWDQLGPKWAQDLAEVAMVNAQLRRILDRAADGGIYGAFLISSICMAAPLIANYVPGLPDGMRQSIGLIPVLSKRIDATEYFAQQQAAQAAQAASTPNGSTAQAATA